MSDCRPRVERDCLGKFSQGRFYFKVVSERYPQVEMILKAIGPGCHHLAENLNTAFAFALAGPNLGQGSLRAQIAAVEGHGSLELSLCFRETLLLSQHHAQIEPGLRVFRILFGSLP